MFVLDSESRQKVEELVNATNRNHALYLVRRQVFTAAAGVVWLTDGGYFLRFAQNGDWVTR
jgi:hypothetical protein